jgi:mRNA interferase MazF
MVGRYQPSRGDFIHIDFMPQSGTEQAGRRPALVLSEQAFNVATGLVFACPVTNQVKGGAFEVPVPRGARLTGVILSEQLKSLDWITRNATFHSQADQATLENVTGRLQAIMKL